MLPKVQHFPSEVQNFQRGHDTFVIKIITTTVAETRFILHGPTMPPAFCPHPATDLKASVPWCVSVLAT